MTNGSSHVSAAHGVVLALVPVMVILAVVVPLPIIPAMVEAFGNDRQASFGISLAVTVITLAIALAGLLLGFVGDRIPRRTVLVVGTAAFAILAPLPLWIDSLQTLIVCRFFTGLALGCMVVSAVGLVGDYFTGTRRAFWLGAQGSFPAAATIAAALLSGYLGQFGWRTPFLLLLAGIPLLAALFILRAPGTMAPPQDHEEITAPSGGEMPWRKLAGIFALTVIASLVMFPPAYEFGYVLIERSATSTFLTGGMTAILGAGAVVGALAFPRIQKLRPIYQLCLCLLVCGIGQFGVSVATGTAGWLAGAAVIGLGQGATVPALSMWLLDEAGNKGRGRATGLFQTILYISQFMTPHLARLVSLSTGAATGMSIYAVASLVLAAALVVGVVTRRAASVPAV